MITYATGAIEIAGDRGRQRIGERAAPVGTVGGVRGSADDRARRQPYLSSPFVVDAPSMSRRSAKRWNSRAATNEITNRITATALP